MSDSLIDKLSKLAASFNVIIPNNQLSDVVGGINVYIKEDDDEDFSYLDERVGSIVSEFVEILSKLKYPTDEDKMQNFYDDLCDEFPDEISEYMKTNWNSIYLDNCSNEHIE